MHLSPLSLFNKLISSAGSKIAGGAIAGIFLFIIFRKVWAVDPKMTIVLLIGLIIAALLCCLVVLLWRYLQTKSGERLNQELASQDANKVALQGVKTNFQKALTAYKTSDRDIYFLPWILLIGEPSSGKSTTLRKSRLEFLLEDASLRGSGGTDKCDWWFTKEAVILDTAGRWAIPPSSDTSGGEWQAFLKLLAKHRKRCPINGVIVTIPTTSLLEDSAEQIQEKAQKLRGKLIELVRNLGVEFPIYIMVSKLDLVLGFAEFCASLSDLGATQVLGWNREPDSTPYHYEGFSSSFDGLVDRFHRWTVRHLRSVPAGELADRIFAFPGEFSHIKGSLAQYLETIFKDDPLNPYPLLWRGCFFSSGLQERGAVEEALGLPTPQVRPYFIYNFYNKVFKERGLVRLTGRAARRDRNFKIAAFAIALVFLTFSLATLVPAYRSLTNVLTPVKENAAKALAIIQAPQPSQPTEVFPILEKLEESRNQPNLQAYAKKFLRSGSENSIGEDIRIIEDALLVEAGYRPLLARVLGEVEKMEAKDPVEKERLVVALGELFRIPPLNLMRPASNNIPTLFSFLPDGGNNWLIPEDKKRLISHFKDFPGHSDYPSQFNVTVWPLEPNENFFVMVESLKKLRSFWQVYPVAQWMNFQANAQTVQDAYSSIIQSQNEDGPKVQQRQFSDFVSASHELQRHANRIGGFSVRSFNEKCLEDYGFLRKYSSENSNPIVMEANRILGKDVGICREIFNLVSRARSDELKHIINSDATPTKDLPVATELMDLMDTFGPLFTEAMRETLFDEPEKSVDSIQNWNENWKSQKERIESAIKEKIGMLSSPEWRKEELQATLIKYAADEMERADFEAANSALEALLTQHPLPENHLKKNETAPVTVRAEWLVGRFVMLREIQQNLKIRHPGSARVDDFGKKIDKAAIGIYPRSMEYWAESIKRYHPATAFLNTSNWDRFRSSIQNIRGNIINPSEEPFKSFLEHMSWNHLEALNQMMGEVRESLPSSVLDQVNKTAYVYRNGGDLRGSLMQAQADFAALIGRAECENRKTVSEEDFSTLTQFYRNVQKDPFGQKERLAADLKKVEDRAKILWSGLDCGNPWDERWKGFAPPWQSLASQFPFSEPKDFGTLEFATASSADMADFFFGPNGLQDFLRSHNPLGSKDQAPSAARKRFLQRSLQWQKFLFNPSGQTRIHSIEIALQRNAAAHFSDKNVKNADEWFTNLDIEGMTTSDQTTRLRLRFSGNQYRSGMARWGIRNPIDNRIVLNAYDQGHSGRTASATISGSDIFLPAFTQARAKAGGLVPILLSDSKNQKFAVALTFRWDEPVPARIGWAP